MQLVSCSFIYFIFLIITISVESLSHDLSNTNKTDLWNDIPTFCSSIDQRNVSLSCQGIRIIKRVIQQLFTRASNLPRIELYDGIQLVDNIDGPTRRARTMSNPIFGFLQDRELRIKLNTIIPTNLESNIKNIFSEVTGREMSRHKKDKHHYLLYALTMGQILGLLAFGALSVATMKALILSSLALLLSIILALKKHHHHEDHGHHVVYAHDGHTDRRSGDVELSPYRGWITNRDNQKLDLIQ